jgi:hypothetical protein
MELKLNSLLNYNPWFTMYTRIKMEKQSSKGAKET